MYRKIIEEKNSIIHYIEFNDLVELVNYIKTTEPCSDSWDLNKLYSSLPEFDDFYGTNSLEEAMELSLSGNYSSDDVIIEVNDIFENNMLEKTHKRIMTPSPYGILVNVPKYLNGSPNCMYKPVRSEKCKYISVFFNAGVIHNKTKKIINNRGVITMALINLLSQLGYQINFNFFTLSVKESKQMEYIFVKLNIKQYNQKLMPEFCYFPMCHPSFFRRLVFAVEEREKMTNKLFKYGSGASNGDINKILMSNPDDIIINSPDELNLSGINLALDTKNFLEAINIYKYLGDDKKIEFDGEKQKFLILRK